MTVAEMTETGEMDPQFWSEYEQASAGKELPPDGAYKLKFPDTLEDEAFEVKQFAPREGEQQEPAFLDVNTTPLLIAEGPYEGYEIRYLRVSTRAKKDFKSGKLLKASDAGDLMFNMGDGQPLFTPSNAEEWKQAFRQLCGRTTPHTVRLQWKGYDKNAQGKAKYLKSSDFPKMADGTRPPYVVRTNANTGEEYKVYANLDLAFRGMSIRK